LFQLLACLVMKEGGIKDYFTDEGKEGRRGGKRNFNVG